MKNLILTIIGITVLNQSNAQSVLNFGAELGIVTSDFARKESYNIMGTDDVTEEWKYTLSPLVGFTSELSIKKHLQFTLGVQYQMIGTKYTYHRDGRIPRDITQPEIFTYTDDILKEQLFHKLCLPVTIGFKYKFGKFEPSLFTGIRPNFFLSGNYYEKRDIIHTEENRDYSGEVEYNPITNSQSPMKRLSYQILFGFSTLIDDQFKISFNYNRGIQIYHSELEQSSWEPRYNSFQNSDYSISLTYFFNNLSLKKYS